MTKRAFLSTTDMLSVAKQVLGDNGFSEVKSHIVPRIDASRQCLFEDAYCLVAVVAFEVWSDLANEWQDVQTSFVELISEHISSNESKCWDCYLLLWTPNLVPPEGQEERQAIQYDTGRLRKMVATGDEIRELSDVETTLLPLLPLSDEIRATKDESVLERVPELLATPELPSDAIRAVVDAFENQDSAMEALHKTGSAI